MSIATTQRPQLAALRSALTAVRSARGWITARHSHRKMVRRVALIAGVVASVGGIAAIVGSATSGGAAHVY